MAKAVARAGGHVTLIFSIHDDIDDPEAQGSRGAGFCLQQGAEATALIELLADGGRADEVGTEDEPVFEIAVFDHDGSVAPIECLEPYLVLIEELQSSGKFSADGLRIGLEVVLELPRSQGFGMSAAGLLAAARALLAAAGSIGAAGGEGVSGTGNPISGDIDLGEFDLASRLAHRVERKLSSGLGDVLASSVGGVELRLEPGAPGSHGQAVGFNVALSLILVWAATEGKHTRDYIDDADWKLRISAAGEDAVSRLRQGGWNEDKWAELLLESDIFAQTSGLYGEETRRRLLNKVEAAISSVGRTESHVARLCMLGTSVAILPISLESSQCEEELLSITVQLEAFGLDYLRTNI